jgi:phosphatidylcholine synthase
MDSRSPEAQVSPRTVAAFAVHVFTACGAACALLALIAAVSADWTRMFLWLGLALIIDGIDGTFARRLRVAELLPRWSGDVLDFVVDFTTYVFVPAYAIAEGAVLPASVALALGLIVTVTGSCILPTGG